MNGRLYLYLISEGALARTARGVPIIGITDEIHDLLNFPIHYVPFTKTNFTFIQVNNR